MSKKRIVKKEIRIACEGAETIDIDDLKEFQGDLKTLSDDNYEKLRKSILLYGFSFPVFVWKEKNINWVLDAHQRIKVLKRMRDEEKYKIPKLPVAFVEASNKKEAAKKLLIASSHYGQIKEKGLDNFMKSFDVSFKDVFSQNTFFEIDFERFRSKFYPNYKEVSFSASENDSEVDVDFKYKIEIDCNDELTQKALMEEMRGRGFFVRVLI